MNRYPEMRSRMTPHINTIRCVNAKTVVPPSRHDTTFRHLQHQKSAVVPPPALHLEPCLQPIPFHECDTGIRLSTADPTNRRSSFSQRRTSRFQLPSSASSEDRDANVVTRLTHVAATMSSRSCLHVSSTSKQRMSFRSPRSVLTSQ